MGDVVIDFVFCDVMHSHSVIVNFWLCGLVLSLFDESRCGQIPCRIVGLGLEIGHIPYHLNLSDLSEG